MTESTFPFGVAGDEAGVSGTGNDRRKLALVAGAGALVVALLGYFVVLPMLSGGSSSSNGTSLGIVHHTTKSKAKAKTTAKAPATKPVTQPASYADVSARQDPFKPLIAAPVAAPVGTTTGTTPTTTTSGSTTSGSTTSSSTTSTGTRVALLHVYSKDGKWYAQTRVGETVFTPVVGSTFGGTYKLLATSGKTATYLFGDEQFSLTEGQEVLK